MIDADGGNLHRIAALSDYWLLGAPDVSPDGRKIAFDAWQATVDKDGSDCHVFVANADGSDAKDLGPGAIPSWSPDGKQLVCIERGKPNQPQRGIG